MRFLIPLTLAAAAGAGLIAIPSAEVFPPPAPSSVADRPGPHHAGDGPAADSEGTQLRLRLTSEQAASESLVASAQSGESGDSDHRRPLQRLLDNSRRVLDQVLHKTTGTRTRRPGVDQYGKHRRRSSRRRPAPRGAAPVADDPVRRAPAASPATRDSLAGGSKEPHGRRANPRPTENADQRRASSGSPRRKATSAVRGQLYPASEAAGQLVSEPAASADERLSPEQLRQIIRRLSRRIENQPADASLYAMRGKAYARLGELARALQDLELAIALDPRLAEAYGNRGLILYHQGKLKRALADFHQVVRLQPQLAKGYLDRAKTYYRLGNLRKALRDASEALRRDSRLTEARRLRAAALLRAGKPSLAAREARRGLAQAPWDHRLRQLLVLAEAASGRYDQALAPEGNAALQTDADHWLLARWQGVQLPDQIALLEGNRSDSGTDPLVLTPVPSEPRAARLPKSQAELQLRVQEARPLGTGEPEGPASAGHREHLAGRSSRLQSPWVPGEGEQPRVIRNPFAGGAVPPEPASGATANAPARLQANPPTSEPQRPVQLVIHDTASLSRPRTAVRSRPEQAASSASAAEQEAAEKPVVRLRISAGESPLSQVAPTAGAVGERAGERESTQVRVLDTPAGPLSALAGPAAEQGEQTKRHSAAESRPQREAPAAAPVAISSRRRKPGAAERSVSRRRPADGPGAPLELSIREPASSGVPSGVPRIVAAVAAEEAEFTLPVSPRADLAPPLRLVLPEQLPALKEATSKALLKRARQRFLQGDLESARDMYDVIVRLEPQSALARAYRALIHWRLNRLDRALADAGWAEKQNPRLALAPAVVALVRQSQGRTKASRESILRAYALAPHCRPIALQAAATLLHLEQPQQALELLQPLLKGGEQDPWALLYASMAWAQQKRYDQALAAVEQALKLWPRWPRALHQRATIALRQHKLQQAIDDWTTVLKLQPDHLPARLHRAEAFSLAQRWAEAVEDLSAVLKRQPENRQARRKRAVAYFRLKAYSEALKDCRQLLSGKEQHAQDRLLLAQVLLALRHHDQALEELERAEKQGLRSAELYYLRARALEAQGESEVALADYAEAFRLDPAYVQAGLNQVRLLIALDRAAEAVELCRRLLQQGVQPLRVRLWLAEALVESGREQEAIEHLQAVLEQAKQKSQQAKAQRLLAVAYARTGRVKESQAAFRKALALEPDAAEVYLYRGLLAMQQDRLDAALDDLQTACRLAPGDPRCRLARAIALERKGLYSQALADLNWLLRHHRSLKAYLVRARIYVAQDAHQLALEDLNQALELNPQDAEIYRLRAALHLKLNRNAEALDDVKQALEHDQEDAELLTIQGEALRRQGKLDQAVEALDRAIELDDKLAAAWISRGMARLNQGKARKALEDLDRAVELVPENPRAYLQRGIIHAHLGDYQQAARDFDQAIELAPADAKTYAYRAMAALKQGQYQDAVDFYTEALRLHPRYALAYYERGKAHWLLGQEDQALADYQRAVELNPIYAGAFYDEQ